MLLELRRWVVPPGHQVQLTEVTWAELEGILEELGDRGNPRLSYSHGTLELMSPSPEHEDNKDIISDLIKILLEEADIEFRNLGSTTFKNAQMDQAVEPDACFYIEHEAAIRGRRRIDLAVDPPPDLAIEIDITARTRFNNYEALGVPELWRYNGTTLEISVLQEGRYERSEQSLHFPDLPLMEVIPGYMEQSRTTGRTALLRAFRRWVQDRMA
jgi:Uma2 family endonuclease